VARARSPYTLSLASQNRASQFNDIAVLKISGWFQTHPDAARRAGGDEIARSQSHYLAAIADQLRAAKNHVAGISRLHPLPVDVQPEFKLLGVTHLIWGD
jgi:predicted component of type VI protein secretion system